MLDAAAAMSVAAPANLLRLLSDEAEFRRYQQQHGPPDEAFFAAAAEALAHEARADAAAAAAGADRLVQLALASGDATCEAYAYRACGNVEFLRGDYGLAVEHYRRALPGFAADALERGRTLSSLLHPLAMLGQREEGAACAAEARACFEACGAAHRLARLEINLASVWFRQDRFLEALEALDRAQVGLETCPEGSTDHEGWAALLVSRAVVLINLARFDQAEQAYRQSRDYALAHQMSGLAAQADYNIGYLYFLRGQYVKAIHALDRARETALRGGDKLHAALCDLDQADVCIELNLFEDALQLAHSALRQFQALNMPYEQAKSLTDMAVAEQFLGRDSAALELLVRAEACFVSAGNEFWIHMAHLYRGVVLLKLGRCFEAMQLSERARLFFEQRQIRTKAVYAGILAARARIAAMDMAGARLAADQAARTLGALQAPWLHAQLQQLLGMLAQRSGQAGAAREAYERAMEQIEATRGNINFDELRISFMRDKSQVYERYMDLLLEAEPAPEPEAVWRHMERAKSRALASIMAGGFGALQPRLGEGSRVVHEISRLREELNWYYRQLDPASDAGAGAGAAASPGATEAGILQAIQQRELQLLRTIRQLPSDDFRLLEEETGASLDRLRPYLRNTTLIEYFHCAEGFVAAVADDRALHIVRLPGERAGIESALRLLRFQVGKRAMESGHFRRHADAFQHAADSHLQLLRRELIRPLRGFLRQPQLLIVPHGVLHALPFGALHEGAGASGGAPPLIEEHVIAMAPSAAVFLLASQRPPSPHAGALLVAAEPTAAREEIRAVEACRPDAARLEGAASTIAAVQERASTVRLLHIAAHGVFRADNPYFSALQLSDGPLNVIDIYNLPVRADLVVLSGCGTALGDLAGGDELIGLARAFLHAGARAVLASLWDVDDRLTAEFMQHFYQAWTPPRTPAQALQAATIAFRRQYPHPFFWAPFQLAGALA